MATGSSAVWVVIPFCFTLVDSFVSLETTPDGGSEDHAAGTIWLWLLFLVICWLWVQTFTRAELKSAIRYANRKAAEKVAKKIEKMRARRTILQRPR